MKALHGNGHDGSFGKALILSQAADFNMGTRPTPIRRGRHAPATISLQLRA